MTQRQEEIINASIELIAEKGIQGLTIKNLSKKIKVTEPAIYRHFESKTEILLAMLNNLDETTETLTQKILSKEKDPLKRIEKAFNLYFNIFAEHPYWVSVIFADEIFKNEDVLAEKIRQILERKENVFVKLLSEAQRSGHLRKDINKNHLATILIGAMRLIVKRWELSKFNFDLNKEGKKLLKSILNLVKQ
jgi:TetR/AcrR family fatty acid metabolism transcriptional regulator